MSNNKLAFEETRMHVRLTFVEDVLGSMPNNENIYVDFIGKNAPDPDTLEDEIAAIGVDAVAEKGMTVFPKTASGNPFLYDYQIKGFFKDTCGGLRNVKGSESAKIKAYKKKIDKLIFPQPREILFQDYGLIDKCQRPLRAQTMQGERTSLACSESIAAGAHVTFDIVMLSKEHEALVREWLNYGVYSGISQWRNSGKGRFVWDELDDDGNVIGGNNN